MSEEQTTLTKKEPNNISLVLKEVNRLTYPQDWSNYNLAQTQEKAVAERLLLRNL